MALIKKIIIYNKNRITILSIFMLSLVSLNLSGIPFGKIPTILFDSSYLIFFTLGTAIILSTGEIDLSVFGIASLSIILALSITNQNIILLALLILVFSIVLSSINALSIVKFKKPSLLITIATYSIFYGISTTIYMNSNVDRFIIPNELKSLLMKKICILR